MNKIKVEVSLFYANWCGHCIRFKPYWDEFVKNVSKKSNIVTNSYEDSDAKSISKLGIINGKPIVGYPTIKITVIYPNKNKKEIEYQGKHNSDDLMMCVKKLLNNSNCDN